MKIETSNRNANYLLLLVLKNTFNLPELASAKEIRIQQLINQKPGHPYCQFYHDFIDATKITRNLSICDIKKQQQKH